MKASSARSSRRTRAVESFASAAECIGPVEPGMALFAVTRGQFSMLDAVQHVITEVGPCSIALWVWAVASSTDVFEALMANKAILSASMVVDTSRAKEVQNEEIVASWLSCYGPGSVRLVRSHAKIARVWTAERKVLIRSSGNFSTDPRFEQIDITEGGEDFDLVARMEASLPVYQGEAQAMAARVVDLPLFSGVQTWRA